MEDLRVLVSMYLRRTELSVATAENGIQALAQITRERFDVVLMGIQMPSTCGNARLQQVKCSVPIVALTTNAMQHDQGIYRAAGFADFLAKPIEPTQMYRVLEKFLAHSLSSLDQY